MKTLVLTTLIALTIAAPAEAAKPTTDTAKLRTKITRLEKANKNLRAALAASRARIDRDAATFRESSATANGLIVAMGTDLSIRTQERDSARTERDSARALLSADTAARLSAAPVSDLWGFLAIFKTRFDTNGGDTYNATLFQGTTLSSYSFDRWATP